MLSKNGMGVRIKLEPRPTPNGKPPAIPTHLALRFGRFGSGVSQVKVGSGTPAEIGFHVAYLNEARKVSEPDYTKVATLAGSIRLEKPGALPIFRCSPEQDFTYVEPEPPPDEPAPKLVIEYPQGVFETPPGRDAPASKLRLPKAPEEARFLEIVCDLKVGGAEEAAIDINGRFDMPVGPVEALITTMPLDQLTGVARVMTPEHFFSWMTPIFGHDIPHAAYATLLGQLVNGAYRMPRIEIVSSLPQDHLAGYDKQTHRIKIKRQFIRDAENDDETSGLLMMALVEEFGHALDDDLRNRFSTVGGDAELDEGAAFGYAIVNLGWDLQDQAEYAKHLRDGETVSLKVRWKPYKEAIERVLGPEEQRSDDMADAIEFFGAGTGHGKPGVSFGHESVEDALKAAFPDEAHRKEIYFGNWLRDYSQALTPTSLKVLMTKLNNPRGVVTELLDLYARSKFEDRPEFRVTQDRLGVYKSEEHIDNPHGLVTSTLDPGFDQTPTPEQLDIDGGTQAANYITGQLTRPARSAIEYMTEELAEAVKAGPTAEGRRRLGQALHTLEDFYSHTNFCELALRAAGKTSVEPWTSQVTRDGKTFFPLVSGKFGGDDTAVSIFLALGEVMQADKNQACEAGKRPLGVKMALVIMRDVRPHIAKQAEGTLELLEKAEQAVPWVSLATCVMGKYLFWSTYLMGAIIRLIANQVDEAQGVLNGPPTINPTHTQLAKDHDDHPLHVLAARCAMVAVAHVGGMVNDAWTKTGQEKPSIASVQFNARLFFVHPDRIAINPTKQLVEIQKIVQDFANDPANAGAIARASSRTPDLDHLKKAKEFAEKLTEGATLERLKRMFGF